MPASLLASVVKSVQYGSISIAGAASSGTATITAVDTTKAVLLHLGSRGPGGGSPGIADGLATLTLTNATTVTAQRATTFATGINVNFCVLEFF